jgi:hypothetical protein
LKSRKKYERLMRNQGNRDYSPREYEGHNPRRYESRNLNHPQHYQTATCRVCMGPFRENRFNPVADICPRCEMEHLESLSHFQDDGEPEVKLKPAYKFDIMRFG